MGDPRAAPRDARACGIGALPPTEQRGEPMNVLTRSRETNPARGSNPAPPRAERMRRMRWRDARLWLGLVLMMLAMAWGASLMSNSDATVTVWRASRDLVPGALPVVEPVAVSLGAAAEAYASADTPIAGRMTLPVSAGSLVPIAAIGASPSTGTRRVTIPVDPLHAPIDLTSGDRVDVWATATDGGSTSIAPPVLVLPRALVVSADRESVGVGGEIAVVIEVPQGEVSVAVAAIRSGVVDLAAVPITDTLDSESLKAARQ